MHRILFRNMARRSKAKKEDDYNADNMHLLCQVSKQLQGTTTDSGPRMTDHITNIETKTQQGSGLSLTNLL